MKLILKTDAYGFHIKIINPLFATKLKEYLPLESKVLKYNNSICFNIDDIGVVLKDSSLHAEEGDVIWNYSRSFLCICLGVTDTNEEETYLKGIKVGHTLASPDEIRQLNSSDKVSISLLEDTKYLDGRILDQSEIDSLVKGLLSGKDKG